MRKRKSLEERYKENRDLEKSIFQTTRSYYKFISRIKKPPANAIFFKKFVRVMGSEKIP